MPVTSHEGNRFYIRMNDDSNDGDPDLKCFARSARMSGLCGVPYNELLEKATLESSKLMQVRSDFTNSRSSLLKCHFCYPKYIGPKMPQIM